jgi:scyllo-inositol 2-dehydrogenase (NADP+)
MLSNIRCGLIGYGYAGRVFHAPLVRVTAGLRLSAVASSRPERVMREQPGVRVSSDATELCRDPELDLVIVAAPNANHFALAGCALAAGKHVVVDKPLTVRTEDAEELIALARRQGVVLSVFHNRRWDGDFLTVRELLERGLLGELVSYEAHYDRFRPAPQDRWREAPGPGAGLLFDLGPHLIDQALLLLGWPRAVTAQLHRQRDGAKTDDAFSLVLHHERFAVRLAGSVVARIPRPRFVLHGTRGSFIKSGVDPQEDALRAGAAPTGSSWGREERDRWGQLDTEVAGLRVIGQVETIAGCYQRYYEQLHAAVTGQAEVPVAAEAGLHTVRIIAAAQRSHETGRTVPLSPPAPHSDPPRS